MNSHFEGQWKTVPAIIFSVIVVLSVTGLNFAQSSSQDAVPVLEGLDPVMLVQGKEVQGNLKITLTRGNFQYMFASEENKTAFEKDPARYEIQLNGACARMGPPVRGNPDLYTVYQGHIYIFGTEECKMRFEAAPANYFEAENEAGRVALTSEALKKGQALIEKAVTAMGSAKLVDGLVNYQEKSTTLQTRHQSDVEIKNNLTILFPDRVRLDQVMPDFANPSVMRQAALVITASEVFAIAPNGIRPMPNAFRIDQEREINWRPLAILRARKNVNFNPAAMGSAKVGETTVEQVAVEVDGLRYTLGIDPTTSRILSLSYRRRGPRGDFGQVIKLFSDFRTVDGATFPFRITATFNGQPWKEQSATVESININSKIDPALFQKP